ncbi:MAG: DoxX family protein [Pseudomonadota bacterium]
MTYSDPHIPPRGGTPDWVQRILDWPLTSLFARLLLVSPFLVGGVSKLLDWNSALAEMGVFGLKPAFAFAIIVTAVEISAPVAILAGRFVWLAAGALGVFTGLATLIAHAFWTFPAPERFTQMNVFFEHLAIIGGLILAALLASRRTTP